jgi:hypothetical protein
LKGVKTESVAIPPKLSRKMDAFHVDVANHSIAVFGINLFLVDWGGYINDYKILETGDYEVDYVVFSEEFPPARKRFKLHIGKRLEDIIIKEVALP